VWHSGSISTYKAHVWLYPDVGIGIFAALPGPQRYDTTDVLYDLMYAISDLVVFGIRPPVPQCSPPTPGPHLGVIDHVPPHPLKDYAGTYVGRWAEMNVTIVQDPGGVLRLMLGRWLSAELRRYDCPSDEFHAVIGGRLWWVAEGLPQRALLPVRFKSSTRGGRPDVVELPLEMDEDAVVVRLYRFTRPGLTLAEDWTSPNHTTYTCAADRFVGLQAWMLFPLVVFQLFTL